MDWMNNLFVILILTTTTGTIFYLLVLASAQIWPRNDIKVMRIQMRITQWAFLLPCVYIILYLRKRRHMPTSGGDINLFYNTPAMWMICAVLACAWMVLFLVVLVDKLNTRRNWVKLFQGNIPEEDAETQMLFDDICLKFGISGKVSLYRNDMLKMPYITYSHGFIVVLPLECYTRKETAVILYHELCHYLNRDFFIGTTSCIVSLLHVFNPLVPRILRQLNLVCEENCDRRACQEGKGIFSEKEYFRTILKSLAEGGKRERYNLFMLADTISDYEKRVQCMKKYHEYGGIKKGTAIVLSIGFIFGSSMIALVAGIGMTEGYVVAAEATDNRVADDEMIINAMDETGTTSNGKMLNEFIKMYDLNRDNVIMMGEEDIELIGDSIYIEWNLAPGKTGMFLGFSKISDDKITITTVGETDDINYQMGIRDPKEFMRYVEGTGTLQHDFLISIDGIYYFFVSNLDNSKDLKIKGTVIQ